jgi:transcriptional regulator with XRE-family HTH domain
VDDLAFGRLVRLARIRKKWRQEDLALAAGVSRTLVSRVERAHLEDVDFGVIRRIAAQLDIRVELRGRSRAIDLDRVTNARHSGLADFLVGWFGQYPGWLLRAEVSYSEFGERGVIDLLCWHAPSRSLLVAEIKTELLEFGELLAKIDAKERLAWKTATRFGWKPVSVSTCLLVADSTTNRRRAAAHASLLRTSVPGGARELVQWLRAPAGVVHALRFVPDVRPGHLRTQFASPTRVRTRPARSQKRATGPDTPGQGRH